MKDTIAVILAGGTGSRSWPITSNKILYPFFGKTLIENSFVKHLPKQIRRVILVVSQENREEMAKIHFSVPSLCVLQTEGAGMAGALKSIQKHITNESLLVINGDDVYDPTLLESIMQKAESDQTVFGIIPGWKTEIYRPLGYIKLQEHRVIEIIEKPGEGNEPSEYVNLVGHFIRDSEIFFQTLAMMRSENDDIYEKTLSALMTQHIFHMVTYDGPFSSFKYPWHLLDITSQLLERITDKKIGKNVSIADNVVITGPVIIEDNVKIYEFTKITGPCFIGSGTIIGNHNIIRASHIGKDCVTGFASDITRSYIGDGCWFHTNYIGDSVLESNISLGSGSVLSNVRLDDGNIHSVVKGNKVNTYRSKFGAIIGTGTRIGSNTTIMPGVKIGSNAAVGPGIVIQHDVKDDTVVYGKIDIIEKQNSRKVTTASRAHLKKLL